MFKINPRLFISYSRSDAGFANSIHSALIRENYTVFFDTESINVGDVFPERIISSLKKCDGCILILSASSVKSEWCKLEAYYAHFYNKPLVPLKIGNHDYDAESPLKSIQKNIHYIIVNDVSNPAESINRIKKSLSAAKQKARNRVAKNFAWVALAGLFITIVFVFGVNRINQINYNDDKTALLSKIKNSDKIYRTPEINLIKQKFNNDNELIAQLHLQETDPGISDAAKINSKIISAALLQSFTMSQRQYFKNIDWRMSTMENNIIANCSFISGILSQTYFKNTEFDDVYFKGIESDEQGIKIAGIEFSNCSFNTVYFDKSNAIDIKFKSCRFKGSSINTTNFGAVQFFSDTGSNKDVIMNGQVTYFENCVFQNSNPPDKPGELVLGKEEEMQFTDVVFDGCRFVGLVRPEWFSHCSFTNCFFPVNDVSNQLKINNFIN